MNSELDLSELNKLMEDWKEIVDNKPELVNAFMYGDSPGNRDRATSYKIGPSQVKKLLDVEDLINIRIIMGYNKDGLDKAKQTRFTPIIGGIGSTGAEKYFKMDFDPDGFKYGIVPKALMAEDDIILLDQAKCYVQNWSDLDSNSMDGIFKAQIRGKIEKLKYHTFHDKDTMSIKTFFEEGEEDISIFLHLGLETCLPIKERPFPFRTVLEINRGSENHTFYQLSSPCPHHCDRIILRKIINASQVKK